MPDKQFLKCPPLRFREFEKEWEEQSLNKFLKERKEKSTVLNQYKIASVSAKKGLILQEERFLKKIASKNDIGYKIVGSNNLVVCPQNLDRGTICINLDLGKVLVSPSYKVYLINYSFISVLFLFFAIRSRKNNEIFKLIIKKGTSSGRVVTDMQKFLKLKFYIPSLSEQNKIASFLILLDERIKIQSEIIKDIELRQKYYLNQLMERQLRFPEFEKEWEEQSYLKEIAFIIFGTNPKNKFYSCDTNNFKKINQIKFECLKSGQIRGLDEFNLKIRYYSTEDIKISYDKLLQEEDLILNKQGKGTAGRIGFFRHSIFKYSTIINSCGCIIRANKTIINSRYLLYFMNSEYIGFKKLHDMAVGTTGQVQIPVEKIKNLIIKYPSLQQQQKITAFLSLLDEKQNLEKNLLQNYQLQKQYYLNNLLI
ncbi:hypothetical protein CWO85_02585 [Candidatus Phytoplasma ziziphi]|uniref:Type I restriction modification DNA specificity domain-containing protein n=1 Tax=Ziziphus jujuba witches'-broom phytoplasma TaxID=135727 RepID=A0A660HMX7_ZIZJU|nr:restriction endonuclease subunit S [Candidatus Phytoplasma ziziphi]AYJ01375.1 hypothetical protein CWO85_02585 [Candidatus Phytoplasma ziziphi]